MNGSRPLPRPRVSCARGRRPPAELLLRSARLLDPRAGLDGPHDLLVRDGEIAEIGAAGRDRCRRRGARSIDGEGLHVLPGFVDPHVHLRTPGREDEEDLESGTRAAAAGGFCCVLAMPNTDPVVDNASVLRSLQERAARRGASCRSASSPRSRKGQAGTRADRDGGARARGRRRLQRRRRAGRGRAARCARRSSTSG